MPPQHWRRALRDTKSGPMPADDNHAIVDVLDPRHASCRCNPLCALARVRRGSAQFQRSLAHNDVDRAPAWLRLSRQGIEHTLARSSALAEGISSPSRVGPRSRSARLTTLLTFPSLTPGTPLETMTLHDVRNLISGVFSPTVTTCGVITSATVRRCASLPSRTS